MNGNEITVGAPADAASQDARPVVTARELLELHRTALVIGLNGSDIEELVIEYSGGGDEGRTGDITVTPSTEEIDDLLLETAANEFCEVEPGRYGYRVSKTTMCLSALLEEMCDLALTVGGHSGYHNNEGGYGSLSFKTATGELKLVHNDYIQQVETTEHDLGGGFLEGTEDTRDLAHLAANSDQGRPDDQVAH